MTSIILITHNNVGEALLNTAKSTLDTLPCPVKAYAMHNDANTDKALKELKSIYTSITDNDSVLILTDMFGSTPSNLAQQLQEAFPENTKLVAGLTTNPLNDS